MALIQAFISRAAPEHATPLPDLCRALAESLRLSSAPAPISTRFFIFTPVCGLGATISVTLLAAFQPSSLPRPTGALIPPRNPSHPQTDHGCLRPGVVRPRPCGPLLAGLPLDWAYLWWPPGVTTRLIPIAILVHAFIYRSARHRWLMLGGLILPILVGSGLAGSVLTHLGERASHFAPVVLIDALLTPTGLAAALNWHALRRHFRTCDLTRPIPWAAHTP